MPVPHVATADRLVPDDLGYADDGITHLSAHFGYLEEPDVPTVLRLAVGLDLEFPPETQEPSCFLSIDLCVGDAPGMTRWRKLLFEATSRITADAAEYFGLPRERVVIMGSRIDV